MSEAPGVLIRPEHYAAIHQVLWYGLGPDNDLDVEVRLIGEGLLANLAIKMGMH